MKKEKIEYVDIIKLSNNETNWSKFKNEIEEQNRALRKFSDRFQYHFNNCFRNFRPKDLTLFPFYKHIERGMNEYIEIPGLLDYSPDYKFAFETKTEPLQINGKIYNNHVYISDYKKLYKEKFLELLQLANYILGRNEGILIQTESDIATIRGEISNNNFLHITDAAFFKDMTRKPKFIPYHEQFKAIWLDSNYTGEEKEYALRLGGFNRRGEKFAFIVLCYRHRDNEYFQNQFEEFSCSNLDILEDNFRRFKKSLDKANSRQKEKIKNPPRGTSKL